MKVSLFACGDIVNTRNNENFLSNELIDIIRESDISICNYEAPITTDLMKPILKAGPHLSQSKDSIQFLYNSGFNIISLANNHIYDYGQVALQNTIDEISKYGMNYIGADLNFAKAYTAKIHEKSNIRIGFIAACENEFGCLDEDKKTGGYAWLFHQLVDDNVRKLRNKVDFIVFVAHAGVENINFPIKEIRKRYQRLCDLGVDVIIGHHPHVPQGFENYKSSIIFYSLGNFYFDTASFVNISDDSYSVVLNFEKNKQIKFEIIYHKKTDYQTHRVNKKDVSFDIKHLNSLLYENYETNNNEIALKLYQEYYNDYYRYALGLLPVNYNLKSKVKFFIKKFFFRRKFQRSRNLMLLHNIKIDSHRFLVQQALQLLIEKEINHQGVAVYSHSLIGHRESYLNFFLKSFKSYEVKKKQLCFDKNNVIFMMIEDSFFLYVFVALLRSLFGKTTSGFLFRPKPVVNNKSMKMKMKKNILLILKKISLVKTILIVPLHTNSKFETIADGWIYDFQFWDLQEKDYQTFQKFKNREKINPLYTAIDEARDNRRVICALGGQDRIKGFDTFATTYTGNEDIQKKFLFAFGGKVKGFDDLAISFKKSGGFSENRFVSDDDLIVLYASSDLVWTLYTEDYDQASGIFGRAVQLGIPVIVRKDSLIHQICIFDNIPHIAMIKDETMKLVSISIADIDINQGKKFRAYFRKKSIQNLKEILGIEILGEQHG